MWTTRKLPVPKAPMIEQTVTPDELVARLNQRWNAFESLTATVEIQASVLKAKQGVAFEGSNSAKKKLANPLENLRPGFFLDALMVRGLEPDDWYGVVADTETMEDASRKHLFTVPEYVLSISRNKPGSHELMPVRVVTFNRDDLLPYQQDLYDSDGNLETQVFYSAYQNFGINKYPTSVIIKRPQEGVQVVLTVDKIVENQKPPLTDGEFVLKPTEGTKIQHME